MGGVPFYFSISTIQRICYNDENGKEDKHVDRREKSIKSD